METPVSLLERLRQPADQAAWGQFVDLYTPLLFSWARRADLSETDAADLVQDVFAILVRKLPEFVYDPDKSFREWLRKVTLNKWRENLRRTSRARALTKAEIDHLADADPVDGFWDREYQQLLVTRARQLAKDQFEPATWQAFWRVVVEGEPAERVAHDLGLSVAAVYAAKYRVLVRLRKGLRGLLE
jgi:RNA polymerase sigma-70 factor (ECF subfamily)